MAILIVATAGLAVLCTGVKLAGEPKNTRATLPAARSMPAHLSPMTLLAIRTLLIERKKAPWQLQEQIAALEIKKQLYDRNLISKPELERSERALATRADTQRIREWNVEDERALSPVEESAGEEQKRPADSVRKGSRGRAAPIRYDGAASWSLEDVEKIDLFFRKRFGRPLPISALGQSLTHDRLRLDHRDAIDVAVRPDSAEGRALMAYLRGAGIPFIAFRGKISSVSTGAHIHIGPPSPRLVDVKQRSTRAEEPAVAERG
ncbi:MAG TPA: hypothetical protein VGB09_10290 [Candidatus Binatia bacterium]